MKQLVKKILPKTVLNAALDLRDRQRLAAVPDYSFNAATLKTTTALGAPAALFADTQAAQQWDAAQADLARVFADIDISGGINPGDRRALYYLILALKPRRVLEVGTHIGASTLHIAHALGHVDAQASVTTVDIIDVNNPATGAWKSLGLAMAPADYAGALGCRERIIFKAIPALDYMRQTQDKFDLIFLDGDHTARAVYQEVAAALPLLNEGGVILLHDYYPASRPLFPDGNVISGPFRALDRIARENPAIEVRPLGALPWETKQGSHMTSLALLTRRG